MFVMFQVFEYFLFRNIYQMKSSAFCTGVGTQR